MLSSSLSSLLLMRHLIWFAYLCCSLKAFLLSRLAIAVAFAAPAMSPRDSSAPATLRKQSDASNMRRTVSLCATLETHAGVGVCLSARQIGLV